MKTTQRILGLTLATLISAVVGFAQSTTTPPPASAPADRSSPDKTNSDGVAPANGKPSVTPTDHTPDATPGSATPPTTTPSGTPTGSSSPDKANSDGIAPATGKPDDTPAGPMAGGTGSGTTPPTVASGPDGADPIPNENASDTAKAVETVMAQFETKRDQAITERQAAIDKLGAAKTDAERESIITELRTETQAQKDEQSALGKQIREELKTLREQRKSGG